MSELSLVLTERFTEADATAIRAALNWHLRVREPMRLYRFSIDPPSIIQLLGTAAAWQILVRPAAAFTKSFFGALGKRAADAAWDGAVAVLSHKRRVRMGLNRALSYDWFSHKANDGKEIQTHGAQWYRTRSLPQAGVET